MLESRRWQKKHNQGILCGRSCRLGKREGKERDFGMRILWQSLRSEDQLSWDFRNHDNQYVSKRGWPWKEENRRTGFPENSAHISANWTPEKAVLYCITYRYIIRAYPSFESLPIEI
ncbi:hypothetical protein AA313_de0200275 [Arthrobotrys entomopaga]|nr:hypothetical protein AA313_de0200275 [Arthrobotrys entomopaga]